MTKTWRPVYLPQNMRGFSSTHETSDEIVMAIFELAAQDDPSDIEGSADHIWTDPSDEQTKIVMERAWHLAHPEEDRLHWGITTMHRGQEAA